ncbi:MAG: hypothetical protein QOG56_10 [Solirubrobacteraceae bacterium]|jgi:hypothetical protein|nr:hypothetical protein [Solirubrobacteraceae bacterium]
MTPSAVACTVGRGLAAGLAGTAAMTVSSTIEMRRRGRASSTAPADASAKVLGIESFVDDGAKARFATLVHWGYGTGWGVVRALLGETSLSPASAGAAHLAAVWGSEAAMLPALGVAPPFFTWGASEVAIDVWHHAVYAAATGLAYELLK